MFSLFVLLVVIIVFVGVVLALGWFPGHMAKKWNSPWAEAITVAGWIGVLLPPLWMIALIWAFVRPPAGTGAQIAITEAEAAELSATIAPLTQRMVKLEAAMRQLLATSAGGRIGG